MPVTKQFHPGKESLLVLWKITETCEDLMQATNLKPEEQTKLNSFKSEARKKEFLVSRLLVQKFTGPEVTISHNEDGKPFLENSDWHISISHTKNIVGILLDKQPHIALDIEYLSNRVEKVAKRFLTEEELNYISPSQKIVHLYQHWCAKECLIKLLGKKDLHLTRELKILPFQPDASEFQGQIHRGNSPLNYRFHHLQFDDYLMVWCCEAPTS
ncbi:MAG: 4'-phosphopantetheinyl transferase superfamily protein [Marinifilaceae bacterium]